MNVAAWKNKVASLGCLICGGPAELHHVREGQGMSQRASDWLCVPLCPLHHRQGTSYVDASLHGAPQAFRAKHGDEVGLLAQTLEAVASGLE